MRKKTVRWWGGAVLALLVLASFVLAQQLQQGNAFSHYAPDIESLLLENGYRKNIIPMRDGARGLRASQKSYTTSIWSRDLDYAISGYSFALGDMSVFRESIVLFLDRVDADGVVPEAIHSNWPPGNDHENRQSWDSMPNIIHATYVYVAKTGERGFYEQYRETLLRVGEWIARLDSDGDGLPDLDIFPYGYYDSVNNGVMHTYALAKFYAAYNELAELEAFVGRDGSIWEKRAADLREGFHRPFVEGGYWPAGQNWPIAWRKADGTVVRVLETFGVFEALRSGLIAPSDARYDDLIRALDEHFSDLIAGPTPMHLTLGGYSPDLLREVDPPVPRWMLDSSAPWIVGLAAPAYAAAGYPQHSHEMMQAYMEMARTTNPPVLEFAAGEGARFGPGNSGDGGRTWDSAGWFLAVYGGHYGLTMTPAALIVQPRPYTCLENDRIHHFTYQGSVVLLDIGLDCKSYRIQASEPITVRLKPAGNSSSFFLTSESTGRTGSEARRHTELLLTLEPGQPYTVVSAGGALPESTKPGMPPPFAGFFGNSSFASVWARADLPVAHPPQRMTPRSWLWGPQPLTDSFQEPYEDVQAGVRTVQYFDKSRMEINDPDAPRDQWYVTNGLLVVEMIQGEIQVGNNSFEPHRDANEAIAGDPIEDNPNAPTYYTFRSVTVPAEEHRAPDRRGEVVTDVIARNGQVSQDAAKASYGVVLGSYNEQTGHNIPRVFTRFFAEQGMVFEQGAFVLGEVMDPIFVAGLPISEPYWATMFVGKEEKDVLIQPFERRVLTYTPANDPQWRVEMGNVGQHYLRWRYGDDIDDDDTEE